MSVGTSLALSCKTRAMLQSNQCSRARHVKCDERRPSCLNCTSTGRECDAYKSVRATSHQQALSAHELVRLCTSKSSPWSDSQVTLAQTLGLPPNEQSNRLFHSFLHGCVPPLTEAMDSDFWQRGILRASSFPAVQHAAIAMGAVYELRMTQQTHRGSLASSLHCKRLEILCSLRYTAAIQVLRHRIAELPKTPGILEEIMVACLMFIFMEILRDDDVAAATHLDAALKLHGCAQLTRQEFIYAGEDEVTSNMTAALEGLTKTFLRLDVQSVLYMGSRTPWYPDRSLSWFHTLEDIPPTFETFLHARDSLYTHLTNIMSFVTPPEGAEKCFPAWSPHPDRGFDIYTIFHGSTYRDHNAPKAATQRRHFMQVLSRWKSAFQGFLSKGTAKTLEALAGCALLWLAYYTTRIKLAVSYTDDECSYDEQLPSFKKIVEQVEAYLKYTAYASLPQRSINPNTVKMPSLKPKKKDFKIHPTVCYPLYYTALKCRYKPLRHCALTMLRASDSEGIWYVPMLARIADFVVAGEEDSSELDSHRAPADAPYFGVPEVNRFHCLSLNMAKARRIIWLKYNRRAIDAQGEFSCSSDPLKRWRIDSTILTWKDPQ